MKQFNTLALSALLCLPFSAAFAGPTEDLAKAVKEHNTDAMKTAIAAGADVNAEDEAHHTPLDCAVWWPDEIQLLLDAKADVNKDGPLAAAATWGETGVVAVLLKAGAKVDAPASGHTPLWWAAFAGSQASTLTTLLDAGADVEAGGTGMGTPLFTLLTQGKSPAERVATIRSQSPYLVKAGLALPPRMLNPQESDYSTLEDMMAVLINHKAKAEGTIPRTGETALMWAARGNRADAVQLLVANKADLNLKSKTNMTALAYACNSKKGQEAGIALVAAGANVKTSDVMGLELLTGDKTYGTAHAEFKNVTPLMLAARRGYAELVKALIAAGADVNVVAMGTDYEHGGNASLSVKSTAASMASAAGFTEVTEILVKAGAKPVDELK